MRLTTIVVDVYPTAEPRPPRLRLGGVPRNTLLYHHTVAQRRHSREGTQRVLSTESVFADVVDFVTPTSNSRKNGHTHGLGLRFSQRTGTFVFRRRGSGAADTEETGTFVFSATS